MTQGTSTSGSAVRARMRRLAGVPKEMANLSDELSGLRNDLAALRSELMGRIGPLPVAEADLASTEGDAPRSDVGPSDSGPFDVGPSVVDPSDVEPSDVYPSDADPSEIDDGFDDGIEVFAERMAVLEDGLDEVGDRLEGMARDGINLLSTKIEQLSQRVDQLASRPSLTQAQLEEALARVVGVSGSSRR